MRPARTFAVPGVLLTALVALAGPASAHVTVSAPEATRGGFTKLVFRVPNERSAPTVSLSVQFPEDAPITNASVKPIAGWTAKVTKRALAKPIEVHGEPVSEAVDTITWTGGRVATGEFQEFEVSAGPLPESDELVFKAVQTYEGGEAVRWIETGEGIERPAPVLAVAPAAETADSPANPAEDESGVGLAGAYGIAGLALVLSVLALARAVKPKQS